MNINSNIDYCFVILSGAKNPEAIMKGIIYSGFFTSFRMTFINYFVILSGAKNPDAILKGIIYSGFFTSFRMTFFSSSKYYPDWVAI